MNLNRRQMLQAAGISATGFCFCMGCSNAPITGRSRVILVPESQEIALGATAFDETLAEEKPSTNRRMIKLVEQVGLRIAAKSGRSDYKWEFRLIDSPTQNAFCLPGGKVAIYEGLIPVCQNEAGLAVVMSHEIAHALARHGAERMSQNIVTDGAKNLLNKVAKENYPERHEQLMQYYGVGTKYLVQLPYSRKQESEADHVGLILMAKAGYEPSVAPGFWNRFAKYKTGEQVHEWFSTHPSDQRRASDLMALMDEAKNEYSNANEKFGIGANLI